MLVELGFFYLWLYLFIHWFYSQCSELVHEIYSSGGSSSYVHYVVYFCTYITACSRNVNCLLTPLHFDDELERSWIMSISIL